MEEADIWRSANLLIQQHGENAVVIAAERAVQLLERGDTAGAGVWHKIITAIDVLMRGGPLPDEASH